MFLPGTGGYLMSRNRIVDAETVKVARAGRGLAASRRPGPDPDVYRDGLAASPRMRVVGAPGCRVFAGNPSIGAAENLPRGDGPVAVFAGTRAVKVASPRMGGINVKAAWKPRGTFAPVCEGSAGIAASGRWLRNGFARDRRIEVETGDHEEGVPCSWMAVGTDGRHDDVSVTPGASARRLPGSSRARGGVMT